MIGTATARAVFSDFAPADSGTLTVVAGGMTVVKVESSEHGSGSVVSAQNVTAGSTVTGYAIARDGNNNFVANVAATWSLASATGGVVNGDLVAATDSKSAVFTGHLIGTAVARAVFSDFSPADSGTLTVVAGGTSVVKVESAADGSGSVISAQNVTAGSSVTGYAIARDGNNNFVANVAATWSLASATSGVVNGDLVAATDTKSAVFTGHLIGTAAARAVVSDFAPIDSGTLTVVAGSADAAPSALTPASASLTANGTSTQVLTVTAKDANGNTLSSGGSTVAITQFSGTGSVGSVLDNDNGTYTATVTAPTAAGSGVFVATLGGAAVKNGTASQTQATVTYVPGASDMVKVESAADGSGSVLSAQNVTTGSSVTGYAIARDANGGFVANIAATWSLLNKTGGVVNGDLVPATDSKSAVFTGHLVGTAAARAGVTGLTSADSGTLTVVGGAATVVKVESADDGSGSVLSAQNVTAGTGVAGYAVSRDANGNFVANIAATWALADKTGGVIEGDLVSATDAKSAVFTGHRVGTATVLAVVTGSTSTGSGMLTVVPGVANLLVVSGLSTPRTAGVVGTVTVTAQDTLGNTATAYAGTVHFTSSDAQAALPSDYAFVSEDSGAHTFSDGVTLKTAGTQSVTATDTVTDSITGTQSAVTVNADVASSANSTLTASPSTVPADGFSIATITIAAKDAYGNGIPGIAAANITVAVSGANNTVGQPTAPTDASGRTTRTLASPSAGTKIVSATVNGVAVTQTASVIFLGVASIPITPVNDAPSFSRGANQTLLEDAGAQTAANWAFNISAGSADEAAQTLTFQVSNDNPALFANQPAISSSGTLSYTPAANANGSATVRVALKDNGGTANGGADISQPQTFTIDITPINDSPTIGTIPNLTIAEGAGSQTVDLNGISSGPNETQTLAVTATSSNPALVPHPIVTYASPNPIGSLNVTPVPDANGIATIHVVVTDDGGTAGGGINTVTAAFSVTVTAVNGPPTISFISDVAMDEDTVSPVLSFTIGDAETAAADLLVSLSSSNPALVPDANLLLSSQGANQTLILLPSANQFGSATITVLVTDADRLSTPRSFNVTVNSVNDAPVLQPIAALTLPEGSILALNVSATDVDAAINGLAFSLGPAAPSGMKIDGSSGLINWLPAEEQGPSSNEVTVVVTDDGTPNLSASQTFQVDVEEVNSAPLIAPIADQTIRAGDTLRVQVAGSDTDIPANAVALSLSADSLAGGTIDSTTGELIWISNNTLPSGTQTLTVIATDNGTPPLTAQQSFKVTVIAINAAPTLNPIADPAPILDDSNPQTITLAGIGAGAAEIQFLTVTATSSNPSLIPNPAINYTSPNVTGTLTFQPTATAIGTATITVVVSDDGGVENGGIDAVMHRFIVTVNPVTINSPEPGVGTPPVVTRQPENVSAPVGGSAFVGVVVSGTELISYQWQLNGSDVDGAIHRTLAFSQVQSANEGSYRVKVRNSAGSAISEPAQLTVLGPVTITRQPENRKVKTGSEATFEVQASGGGTIRYQWYRGTVELSGATSSTLTFGDAQANDSGNYSVLVRNEVAAVVSREVALAVLEPVRIVQQMRNQTARKGDSVTFSVEVTGAGPLEYSWEVNGVDFRQTAIPSLILTDVQPTAAGTYRVQVSNAVDSVLSAEALLTVIGPPTITPLPAILVLNRGQDLILTVAAEGQPPFTYQWIRNGVNIPGAIEDTYIARNVQPGDGGTYSVNVTDAGGAITSNTCNVIVLTPALDCADNLADAGTRSETEGQFSCNNTGTTRESGEPDHSPGKAARSSVWLAWKAPSSPGLAAFDTRGSGFDTILAVYTGPKDDITQLKRIASDEDGGGFLTSLLSFNTDPDVTYYVAIDGYGGAAGEITVSWNWNGTGLPVPVIVTQPISQTILSGDLVTFAVVAESTDGSPLAYQWLFDGAPISGATSRTLTFENVQGQNAGNYNVRVQNANDTSGQVAESFAAVLQVNLIESGLEGPQLEVEDKFGASLQTGQQIVVRSLASRRQVRPQALLRGFRGSKVFSNKTAVKDAGEPNHCRIAGGASAWFAYEGVTNAVVRVSTERSDFDTLLAVYVGPPGDYDSLVELACDNDSGQDGKTSVLYFPTTKGTLYNIAVDGALGAKGLVFFQYEIAAPPVISQPPHWVKIDAATGVVSDGSTNPGIVPGDSVQFIATAINPLGQVDLTYQWRFNGTDISGATHSSYALKEISSNETGDYSVVVGNFSGRVTSAPVRLTFSQPANILTGLENVSTVVGSSVSFSVAAGGVGPLRYQWTHNGTVLVTATDATILLDNAQLSDGGEYAVTVSNPTGSVEARGTLTVGEVPLITEQPRSQVFTAGHPVGFQVEATGTAPLSYQWQFDGVDISGANSPMLSLENVQLDAAGGYSVVVSNAFRSAISDIATLKESGPVTVVQKPSIIEQPTSQAVRTGASVTLNVGATGADPLSYQWRFNGASIVGASNSSYTISAVEEVHEGRYQVRVSNPFGVVVSDEAELCLVGDDHKVKIVSVKKLSDLTVRLLICGPAETNALLQASADLRIWTVLTDFTFSSDNLYEYFDTDAADYRWRTYQVAPRLKARIVEQPRDLAVPEGSSATFTAIVGGTVPLSYQWKHNGSDVPGATNAFLVVANAQHADMGAYQLQVTNLVSRVTSEEAQLCVLSDEQTVHILSVRLRSDRNTARVLICGPVGKNGILQASSDFSTWTPLTNFTFESNLYEHFDLDAGQAPWRFYKVAPLAPR